MIRYASTWGWIALGRRKDPRHAEAAEYYRALSSTGERISPERFAAAWDLHVRLMDKARISFTDLTSMIIMRECGVSHVLSEDRHFAQVGFGFQSAP
ncbi:MAG TPA: hypothetical protein PLF11_16790 [Bacillota bacterium]|nr:hypothetical protein [Bacillota bacterium]HPU76495.1 hypothetical protein [Bacillota bacterium]